MVEMLSGVYGFPRCPGEEFELCDMMRELLSLGAYLPEIQDILVQAQYWHDPVEEDEYREFNIFLADINQENGVNETYKKGIKDMSNLVLVKFNQDMMVEPKESQWFGYYHPGQAETTYTLRESDLYLEDKLGLQELDKRGGLHFLEVDGDHLQFSDEWFVEEIVKKFL